MLDSVLQGLNEFGKTIGIDIGSLTSSMNTGTHVFPSNLSRDYYMEIQFFEYSRQNLNSIGTALPRGKIRLPIAANLVDAQGVNYGEEALTTSLGGATNAVAGNAPGGALFDKALNAAGAGAVGGVAAALGGTGQGLVGAMFGITANPFLTVLFKNPNYREYEFAWRLTPRNPTESAAIQNIYKSVKYHQLPKRSEGAGGAVLAYPSLVKVSIKARQESLYPFKYGVIVNSSFNFAPDGAPSFFRNGNPTSIDFRLSVKEVEYFLKGDNQRMFQKI
jgi:hypothetical protein